MRPQTIRAQLTTWYVAVLATAMLVLASGSWWLFRRSVITEADSSLVARIEGVRQYISAFDPKRGQSDLDDELKEYGQLSAGEALLEITDASGRSLYRPVTTAWADIRIVPLDGRTIFADRYSAGRPFRVAAATVAPHGDRYQVITAIAMGPSYAAWLRFGWLLALLLPTVSIAAAAGGYWISRRALAPVDRMTEAVRAITLRNLDRRLDVPAADDELRRLATTFNDMLGRLEASVSDIVRFTADASHELRTPVSLIRTTADITLARPRDAAEYRDALTDVVAHAERMSRLVQDLLTIARADAGVEVSDVSTIRVAAMVRSAMRDSRAAADQRGIRVTCRALDEDAAVHGAAESLRRLCVILLDNAIKYTPRDGTIEIAVRRDDRAGDVVIEIGDSGPGIDAADRPFVFERFFRGAAARATTEGSGLGLSIARAIVERHGGAIEIDRAAAGGCLARIRLRAVGAVTYQSSES